MWTGRYVISNKRSHFWIRFVRGLSKWSVTAKIILATELLRKHFFFFNSWLVAHLNSAINFPCYVTTFFVFQSLIRNRDLYFFLESILKRKLIGIFFEAADVQNSIAIRYTKILAIKPGTSAHLYWDALHPVDCLPSRKFCQTIPTQRIEYLYLNNGISQPRRATKLDM